MRRLGFVAGVAVAVMAGCASSPPVPQWKDPEPSGAVPAVSDALAAPLVEPSATPDDDPVPLSATASPEPSSPAGVPVADERFLAAVRGRLADATVDLRNEEITRMGGQACASLAAGQPRRAVAAELAEYGLPDAAARELVALARSTLCES
ncbi:DUF732 domain-containing protein [Actinoplanes xinjiangensis]|uniref:DUF732 domain-containing protein n=1 Tax=Actinoplanes xinjiangensis TaxID=512350 RepID=UPI00343B9BAB